MVKGKAAGTPQGFEVAATQVLPVTDLREPDYNPNRMDEKELAGLEQSMGEFGVVEYPVVNVHPDRHGVIVGGSHRVRLARKRGQPDLPCIVVNLPWERERELNLRLNKHRGTPASEILREFFDPGELFEVGYSEAELREWEVLTGEAAAELESSAQPGGPAFDAATRFGGLADESKAEAAATEEDPAAEHRTATPEGQELPTPQVPMRTLVITGPAELVDPCREHLDQVRRERQTSLAETLHHALGLDEVAEEKAS